MERIQTIGQENKALDILTRCLHQSHSITWLLDRSKNRLEALRKLTQYCFHEAHAFQGAYISSDEKGVMFFYRLKDVKKSFSLFSKKLTVAFSVTGIVNAIKALRLRRIMHRIRPSVGWYGWLLASDPDCALSSTTQLIQEEMFKRADETQLPIYAETMSREVRFAYQKLGFVEYECIEHPYADCHIYFMKRNPIKK